MKTINHMFFLIVSICLFLNSCATTYAIKSIPKNERENHEFIGKVSIVYFTQFDTVENTYARLLGEAEQRYNGNIDVVNVKIKARFRGVIIGFMTGGYYKITAKGDVVTKVFDSNGLNITIGNTGYYLELPDSRYQYFGEVFSYEDNPAWENIFI